MTKQIKVKNFDIHGWETKISYRKSMNDVIITQKNEVSIRVNGSNQNNNRFVYVPMEMINQLILKIKELREK